MADERLRRLERLASQGDIQAAERLYWERLRLFSQTAFMDRILESLLTEEDEAGRDIPPSVWDKLRWLANEPPRDMDQAELRRIAETWTNLESADDLHRIPRLVRRPGFTTYVSQERAVFRLDAQDQWQRVASLSSPPPSFPFHVVNTLRDRGALSARDGDSCLVLDNKGVYRAYTKTNQFSGTASIQWIAVRIEK